MLERAGLLFSKSRGAIRSLSLGQRLAIVQAALSAIATAAAYSYLVTSAGTAVVGLLAVSQAYFAVFKLADPLSSSGLGRFVALALSRNYSDANGLTASVLHDSGPREATSYIDSHFIGAIGFGIFVSIPGVLLVDSLSPVSSNSLDVSATALIMSVATTSLIASLASATSDAVDGAGHPLERCVIQIVGVLVFIITIALTVNAYGVFGFIFSQGGQWLFVSVLGRWFLKRKIANFSIVPRVISAEKLMELGKFGVRLQLSNVLTVACEPLLKLFLSSAGSLGIVGIVELSLRCITAVRGLIVSAFTPKIPSFAVASLHLSSAETAALLRASNKTLGALCIGFVGITTFIGFLLGSYSQLQRWDHAAIYVALVIGYAFNTCGVVAYLFGQAAGQFRWNYISQAAIPLCMVAFWIGSEVVGYAELVIVAGFSVGLVLSGVIINIGIASRLRVAPQRLWRGGHTGE